VHGSRFGEAPLEALGAFLEAPPALPAWPEWRWRRVLCSGPIEASLRPAFADERLAVLLRWTASLVSDQRVLGALATTLRVLDGAVARGERDASAVAAELEAAVRRCRPLGGAYRPQARTSPSPYLERLPAAPGSAHSAVESPLGQAAVRLLRLGGVDLRRDARLVGRLTVALDVAVAHWLEGASPGTGLPAFRAETTLRSDKRLAVLLGADRDLLHLVYGPQPGRGRPIEVARRRGLAYWVALAVRADHEGRPVPVPPPPVVAHWRSELARLDVRAADLEADLADRSDRPSLSG
jgi:hypothetical protein